MKAAFISEHGGPEKLTYGDVPAPAPKSGEVLVEVRACALNHLDIWVRMGSPAYRVRLPHILGADVSGVLLGAAEGLPEGLKAGDPVVVLPALACWNCANCLAGRDNQCANFRILGAAGPGGYAEQVAVPARNVFPKPAHLSFEESAAFPLTFLTAWHMLVGRARLRPGERVLVLGAGSGVGVAAIQIAKSMGASVIAATSSDSKRENALKWGADDCISSRDDFSKEVLKRTDGQGVEVVFEHVGPATWDASIRSLARCGRLVTCGATTGPNANLDLRYVFSRDLAILGARMGTRAEFEALLRQIGKKKLQPVVSHTLPLREARKAHELMESSAQFGKIVLRPELN